MRRIIQVGLGAMGQGWADCVAKSEKWEAAAYVDINRSNLMTAAERHGMPKSRCFRDLNTALRSVEADAVLDITPQQCRRAVCTTALECGMNVLCEKPLADTVANAQVLAELSRSTGRVLMVAQNYRYQPVVQTAKRVVASGKLGCVGYMGISFHKGPHFGGYREQMAYPLLLDMSIHHFDMVRCISGKDITAVQGLSINAPWNWNRGDSTLEACLELEGGIGVNYFASWVSRGWETDWNGNWRIEGDKGVLLIEDSQVYFTDKQKTRRKIPLVKIEKTHQDWLLDNFCIMLQKKMEPETSAGNNLNSLAATHAVVKAIQEKRRFTVQELLDDGAQIN